MSFLKISVSITILIIVALTAFTIYKTRAAPKSQQLIVEKSNQLTEVESLRLENIAYRQQLLKIEADQVIDSVCKNHGFDKCEVNFQTKEIKEKK